MYKTTLKIDGMMCGMCESHINDTIRKAAAVKKVSSSHTKGEAVVITEEPLDVDAGLPCPKICGFLDKQKPPHGLTSMGRLCGCQNVATF